MKNIKIIAVLMAILILSTAVNAFAREVSFTQGDRDRLVRLEVKVDEGLKAVNQRIDAVNQRIDDVNNNLGKRIDDVMNLLYVVIGGIIALIGFVIWGRRSALAPAIKKNRELEEREERLEKALREYARKEPALAEALRNVGLM